MSKKLAGAGGDDVVRRLFDADADRLRLLQASAPVLTHVLRATSQYAPPSMTLQVLASPAVLKRAFGDFIVASAASALVEDGRLVIRTTDDPTERSIALLADAAVSFAVFDDTIAAFDARQDDVLRAAEDTFERVWETAEGYDVRTPPISRVMATLRDDIGSGTADDFAAILDTLDEARGDGEGLDEIAVALLAAARNEVLLYDISKWGEDNDVASKATFSRKKTAMEDSELLDTENVPIDIGRPRLRLTFADDELQEAPIEDLVERATRALG